MFVSKKTIARHAVTVGLLSSIVFGSVPAFAADEVTQGISAGSQTASVADLGLTDSPFNHATHPSASSMTLTADDSSGSDLGWNVTISSSDFVYSGALLGSDIVATNFTIGTPGTPSMT